MKAYRHFILSGAVVDSLVISDSRVAVEVPRAGGILAVEVAHGFGEHRERITLLPGLGGVVAVNLDFVHTTNAGFESRNIF